MPLADLMQTLERDTAAQIRAVLAAAEANAAQVEADAMRSRDEQLARAAQHWCDECQCRADTQLATAQHAARTRVLEARAAMLDRVHEQVRALLPGYLAAVGEALATAAIECAGERPGVLRCTPALAEVAHRLAPSSLRVEPAAAVRTGVIIELAAGTQIVATLDALLAREWPRLAAAIVARIAEEARS